MTANPVDTGAIIDNEFKRMLSPHSLHNSQRPFFFFLPDVQGPAWIQKKKEEPKPPGWGEMLYDFLLEPFTNPGAPRNGRRD